MSDLPSSNFKLEPSTPHLSGQQTHRHAQGEGSHVGPAFEDVFEPSRAMGEEIPVLGRDLAQELF